MSNKPKSESVARKSRRKQKKVGRGDGFTMDDLHKDRRSDKEREARKFEKNYRRYGPHKMAGYTLVEMMIAMISVMVMVVIAFFCLGCKPADNGIIILEGYSEAVAMCDGGGEFPPEPLKYGWGSSVATQYNKDGILMIINEGYSHHPSNEKLFQLAKEKCAVQFTSK